MKAPDLPPCPACGCALTEFSEVAASGGDRHHYDCACCGWSSYGHVEPLTVATAAWTRTVWAEVEAARAERDRLMAAAPELAREVLSLRKALDTLREHRARLAADADAHQDYVAQYGRLVMGYYDVIELLDTALVPE